jgi:dihydroorotase
MRFLPILLLTVYCLPAQQPYDLLLAGGHVIDAKSHTDGVRDVAIADGRIARVAPHIDASQARKVVNCSGLYVTPDLLDIHVHVYHRLTKPAPGRNYGVDPVSFSFRSGITTMVDAGTTGWKEFPDFREQVISRAKTRVLAFLNIVAPGMVGPEKEDDPREMDAEGAARCARANADVGKPSRIRRDRSSTEPPIPRQDTDDPGRTTSDELNNAAPNPGAQFSV